jgi:hypothetical protein
MYRRWFSSSSPLPLSSRSFGPLGNTKSKINAQPIQKKEHIVKESFQVVSKKCAIGLLNLNHAIPIQRREPLNWSERTVNYRDQLSAWTQRFGLADLRIKSLACALDHSPFDDVEKISSFFYEN